MDLPVCFSLYQIFTNKRYTYLNSNLAKLILTHNHIFFILFFLNFFEILFYVASSFNDFKNSLNLYTICIFCYSIFLNLSSSMISLEFLKKINEDTTVNHLIKHLNVYFYYTLIAAVINNILLQIYLTDFALILVNIFIFNINIILYLSFYTGFVINMNILNLDSLTLNKVINEHIDTNCCICLDNLEKGSMCHLLQCCNNLIHIDCYILFYSSTQIKQCPLCRKDFD